MSRLSEAQELQKALRILYPDHYAHHIEELDDEWYTPHFGPITNTPEDVSKLYNLYLELKTSFPEIEFCNRSEYFLHPIDALDGGGLPKLRPGATLAIS